MCMYCINIKSINKKYIYFADRESAYNINVMCVDEILCTGIYTDHVF